MYMYIQTCSVDYELEEKLCHYTLKEKIYHIKLCVIQRITYLLKILKSNIYVSLFPSLEALSSHINAHILFKYSVSIPQLIVCLPIYFNIEVYVFYKETSRIQI